MEDFYQVELIAEFENDDTGENNSGDKNVMMQVSLMPALTDGQINALPTNTIDVVAKRNLMLFARKGAFAKSIVLGD